MQGEPLVSVIMGIYQCEQTLPEALDSILNQTYPNWEMILCDDGSRDSTYEIACRYQSMYPDKIKVLRNSSNMGLNFTLNHCLQHARGQYIARMDGDDRCDPSRFQKEVDALQEDKSIAIVSTAMEHFDESGVWGKILHPEYPQPRDFLYGTPFCHAPCMVRKEAFDAVQGYSEGKWLMRVEDYHLWIKMYAQGFRGRNLQESLYQMRDDRNAASRRRFRYRLNEAYVKACAVKELELPWYGYVYVLRPILVALLPGPVYHLLHRRKLCGTENE